MRVLGVAEERELAESTLQEMVGRDLPDQRVIGADAREPERVANDVGDVDDGFAEFEDGAHEFLAVEVGDDAVHVGPGQEAVHGGVREDNLERPRPVVAGVLPDTAQDAAPGFDIHRNEQKDAAAGVRRCHALVFGCAGLRSLLDAPLTVGEGTLTGFMFGELVTFDARPQFGNLMAVRLVREG